MAGPTGTIFDSPWFTLERPAFEKLASFSELSLTMLLIIAALFIVWIALSPNVPTIVKAVTLAYITLP
jgi:hypothetical protein